MMVPMFTLKEEWEAAYAHRHWCRVVKEAGLPPLSKAPSEATPVFEDIYPALTSSAIDELALP